MRRPEQELQKVIITALRLALPKGWIVAHYPAGGYRRRTEASILKGMGVVAGFPDIMIFGPVPYDRGSSVWFIEVKVGGAPVTPVQRAMHERLRELGFDVAVVRSLDEVFVACRLWHMPIRMTGI